ncbi:HNH endonuclease [Telmatobacter sp. DSM 110680]|uniref:HNH endonuclease n=1 Tax=Telmatobacter sp. DSM 110680 TaxID=3036704 RepID=A0AAU7DIF3_9BACT
MIDGGITSGERLCNFVNHRLLSDGVWSDLELLLESTGRSTQLVAFFRQIAAVTLTGRIVAAGLSINGDVPTYEVAFQRLFKEHLRDVVGIPGKILNEMYRFGQRAVEAALQGAPMSLQKQMRAWALNRHHWCYMCGQALEFNQNDPVRGYTLEHIWPQSYGGDSIEDNFLPACQSCNSKKKANFATWAMPPIQSLLYGIAPDDQRLEEIHGSFKFSLHYRAAQVLAIKEGRTLKEAFLKIGPWTTTRFIDADDVADFFNLENHKLY